MPGGRPLVHAWARVAERVHHATTKPVMMLGHLSSAFDPGEAARLRSLGIPVLLGTRSGLTAIAGSIAWHRRRRERRSAEPPPPPPPDIAAAWKNRARMAGLASFDTAESLALAADFGMTTVPGGVVGSAEEAVATADALGYPVVLKTLAAGIDHKFDQRGVILGLGSPEAVAAAYRDVAGRFGPRGLIQAHAAAGTEIILGMSLDPQFGPLLTVGLGGIFVEIIQDVVTFLPPVDAETALFYLRRLKGFALLDGARNRPRADLRALADAVVRFSVLVAALAGAIQEIDINPIIAGPLGAFAVDALVVPAGPASGGPSR
jgi:acyl-CoA synthetase (NDP forming)